MIIFSKFAESAKSLFKNIASHEELDNENCALMDENESLMQENLALMEENLSLPNLTQEKNALLKDKACLINIIDALLAENNQLKKLARVNIEPDFGKIFSPGDVGKIQQIIATNPETKENWHTLNSAISNQDIDGIFHQLNQLTSNRTRNSTQDNEQSN